MIRFMTVDDYHDVYQLVDKIIQQFRILDVNEVDLIVMENNFIGNSFWERRGFLQNLLLNYRRKVI